VRIIPHPATLRWMSTRTVRSARAARLGRIVMVLLVVEIVVFAISTVPGVRSQPGFSVLFDGWIQGATYVTAAVLCGLRVVASPVDRGVWAWFAGALALRALGFVIYLSIIRTLDPQPYPSFSDYLWLAMPVLLFIGLVALARAHATAVAPTLWLDALVGALAISGIAVTTLWGTLDALTAPGTPPAALVTNVAYPLTDLALLLAILGVLVAFDWRPPPAVWLLGAGIAGFAVVDSIFLYQIAGGTYRPGHPLAAVSLVATSLIAVAAWLPSGAVTRRRLEGLPGLLLPAVFALACIGQLLYASYTDVVDMANLLTTLGLVAAVLRTMLTLEELRRERVLAEAALREAERANRAKSDFLSRMSHELRTPLNAILGFGELLERDDLTAEQQDEVDHITSAGRHLLGLIDEVLDLARVESGRMYVEVEPVRVAGLIDESLGLVAPQAAERGIALHGPGEEWAGTHVRADPGRLRQVVLNLLSNAVKYNRDGGSVRVTCRGDGQRLRVEIADTGVGMSEADRSRLFVPFERLSARGRIQGTGLGLVLAERMVVAMGGEIGVRSAPGAGSTFWFELDVAGAPAEEAPVPASVQRLPRLAGPARSVLSVEDNESNQRLIEQILSRRPEVTLLTAQRGGDALELARRHLPSLVLLDLHLADGEGEAVLRRLRADPATAGIPVIIVSADATPTRLERLTAGGAHGYLTKPFRVDALLALVDAHDTPAVAAPATRAPTGGAVLDPLRVQELRELDDDGSALRALARAFLEDAADRVGEVTAAAQAGDAAEVTDAAHALMGAADTFGAPRLGERAAAIRETAAAGELPDGATLDSLASALDEAKGAFARLVERTT
jgi:signal transduction histidine kinase/CheY-like chemotaxis protein/HPt (histidine-containing phosphotransfer) domain-containing protein